MTEIHPKHLTGDERRAETVEAVIALAGSQNPSEITTAAIAKHMNLTQGALFRHFPSKDAIWQAVIEWVADRLIKKLDSAASGIASPLEAMEAMFRTHAEFVTEHPGVPRMMLGELQRSGITPPKRMAQALVKRYEERLHRLIDEGKALGEISETVNTKTAATLFIGMIQGLVMQSMISGDANHIKREAGRIYELYRCGLKFHQTKPGPSDDQ